MYINCVKNMNKGKMKKLIISMTVISIFGISINVLASNISQEYNKDIEFMDENVSVKLSKTRNADIGNFQVYKDSQNNEYIYKNQKLVGYFSDKEIKEENNNQRKSISLNEIDYTKIAENYAKEFIDVESTSFEKYQFEKSDVVSDYNEINYTYTKFINGFKTNDSITVSLNFDGTLASVSASRQGLFDNLIILATKDEIKNYVDNYMSENYPSLEYKVSSSIVDYIDNKYVISNFVVINNDGEIFTDTVYYDL